MVARTLNLKVGITALKALMEFGSGRLIDLQEYAGISMQEASVIYRKLESAGIVRREIIGKKTIIHQIPGLHLEIAKHLIKNHEDKKQND